MYDFITVIEAPIHGLASRVCTEMSASIRLDYKYDSICSLINSFIAETLFFENDFLGFPKDEVNMSIDMECFPPVEALLTPPPPYSQSCSQSPTHWDSSPLSIKRSQSLSPTRTFEASDGHDACHNTHEIIPFEIDPSLPTRISFSECDGEINNAMGSKLHKETCYVSEEVIPASFKNRSDVNEINVSVATLSSSDCSAISCDGDLQDRRCESSGPQIEDSSAFTSSLQDTSCAVYVACSDEDEDHEELDVVFIKNESESESLNQSSSLQYEAREFRNGEETMKENLMASDDLDCTTISVLEEQLHDTTRSLQQLPLAPQTHNNMEEHIYSSDDSVVSIDSIADTSANVIEVNSESAYSVELLNETMQVSDESSCFSDPEVQTTSRIYHTIQETNNGKHYSSSDVRNIILPTLTPTLLPSVTSVSVANSVGVTRQVTTPGNVTGITATSHRSLGGGGVVVPSGVLPIVNQMQFKTDSRILFSNGASFSSVPRT